MSLELEGSSSSAHSLELCTARGSSSGDSKCCTALALALVTLPLQGKATALRSSDRCLNPSPTSTLPLESSSSSCGDVATALPFKPHSIIHCSARILRIGSASGSGTALQLAASPAKYDLKAAAELLALLSDSCEPAATTTTCSFFLPIARKRSCIVLSALSSILVAVLLIAQPDGLIIKRPYTSGCCASASLASPQVGNPATNCMQEKVKNAPA
jgi:hypothetical protein